MLDIPNSQRLWKVIDEYEELKGIIFFIKCLYCEDRFRSDAVRNYATHLLFYHEKSISLQAIEFLIENLKKERLRQTEEANLKKTINSQTDVELLKFNSFWNRIDRVVRNKSIRKHVFKIDPISLNFCKFMRFIEHRRKDIEAGKKRYYLNTAFKTFWNAVERPMKIAKNKRLKSKRFVEKTRWRYQNDPEFRKKKNAESRRYHQLHPEVHTKAWKKYAEKRRIRREQNIYEDMTIP